jgi:hypothetical protein
LIFFAIYGATPFIRQRSLLEEFLRLPHQKVDRLTMSTALSAAATLALAAGVLGSAPPR